MAFNGLEVMVNLVICIWKKVRRFKTKNCFANEEKKQMDKTDQL